MKTLNLMLVLILLATVISPVLAQGEGPHVAGSTKPVLPAVREAVNALLAASPPVPDVEDYVITYSKSFDPRYYTVSVAAVDPFTADWHIEDAIWWGTMELTWNGDGYDAAYAISAIQKNRPKVAALKMNGGSANVRFPWQAGKNAMYGTRGVHGGAFGTSGMVAVDWVGGNDMGSNVMSDTLYASDAGEVDAICEDGTSVGVRLHNSTTGEYFAYLHMVSTTSFSMGQDFLRGSTLGTLRHGSFDDTCGWADQQDDHYHVHWGFMPASGSYQAEGCVLDTSSQVWDCGDTEVSPGEMMYGGGGSGTGTDDPTAGAVEAGFWDFMLAGMGAFMSAVIVPILPAHEDIDFLETIVNGIISIFAITYVITKGSVTLYPAFICIGVILFLQVIRAAIMITVTIIRMIKLIPFF